MMWITPSSSLLGYMIGFAFTAFVLFFLWGLTSKTRVLHPRKKEGDSDTM